MWRKFGAIGNEFLSQESWQVRLQVERVVRNREDRQKIQIKTPSLPSSGRILVNLIWGHTKSTSLTAEELLLSCFFKNILAEKIV